MMEGMDDWMEDEDHPHPPSHRPFPLSQLDQNVLEQQQTPLFTADCLHISCNFLLVWIKLKKTASLK